MKDQGTTVVEGQLIQNGDPMDDDRDQQHEFFTLYDEMSAEDRNVTWITVTRIPTDDNGEPLPNSKTQGHLFQAPLGTMSASDIVAKARKFIRPGKTSIMVRCTGNQKGRRGVLWHKIFMVEKENEDPKSEAAPQDRFEQIFRMMQEAQSNADARAESLRRELLAAQSQAIIRPVAATNPMDDMQKMMMGIAAMMGSMMTLMKGNGPTSGIVSADPADGMLKLIAVMKAVKGMNGEEGGGGDDGESLSAIIGNVAKIAAPLLTLAAANKVNEATARQPRRRIQAPQASATPQKSAAPQAPIEGTATDATPQVPPDSKKEQDMNLNQFRENLKVICDVLGEEPNIEKVADMVLATIPEEDDLVFFEQVSSEHFIDQCAMLYPRVSTMRDKFVALRDAIIAKYDPDKVVSGGAE